MAKLSEVNPFIHIDGNKAYTNNGSILLGFRLDLPEIFTLTESDYEAMQDIWYTAFKSLPKKVIIHKQDIYLKDKFPVSEMPGKTYLQKKTQNHFKEREYLKHHSFLYFTLANHEILSSPALRNPFVKPLKKKDAIKAIEESNEIFNNQVARSIEYLKNSRRLNIDAMSEDELRYMEMAYFNGFDTNSINDFDLKNLEIGDKKMNVLAIPNTKYLGEKISTSVRDQLMSSSTNVYHQGFLDGVALRLNCEHIFNQIIFMKDHAIEKKKIDKSQRDLKGSRKFDEEYDNAAKKLKSYLQEMADDESIRLVGGHFNIVYFSENEAERKINKQKIEDAFKSVDVIPYYPSKDNQRGLISNSFPGFVGNIDKDNIIEPIDLQQLCCMLPNTTNYKNDDTGIWFNDRLFNIPVRKDVWDKNKKRIKARNFKIIAPTGEGKSATAQHIFRQYIEDDVNLVIFDLGNSYQKMSLLYPGQTAYLRYEEGKGLGIDPFALSDGEIVSSGKIEELAVFCFKMWKREQLPTDQEEVSLRKVIDTYYKSVNENHSFPNFYDFVETYQEDLVKKLEIEEFFNAKEFLHLAGEFVRDAIYSFLFKNNTNVLTELKDKKIIIIELDEVKDKPTLLSLMLHLGSEIIRKTIWSDRSKKGIIFFDEFAKMLQFPSVLTSTAYFYQAIRKYNGGVGIALQSISQLPDNDISQAMIENTQIHYILQNSEEGGYLSLVERLKLSEHQHIQMKSIQSNFGGKVKYSELGLKIGKSFNIVRIELAKEALLAYSSDGDEYEEIMKIYESCGNMENAIDKYMKYEN